jgi:hypothetical protein
MMIRLSSNPTAKKRLAMRYFFSIFFLGAAILAGIGSSSIRADTDTRFQNDAQTQHAQNIAIEAAFRDPQVIEAKNSGNYDLMNRLVDEKVAEFMQQIADMRASGLGWGNIARNFDVHPGVLGLGHSKMDAKQPAAFAKSRDNRKNSGLALGHSSDLNDGRGAGHGGGNGGGRK